LVIYANIIGMISFIKGKVFRNSLGNPSFVEIETNGGVGYRIVVHKRFDFRKEGEDIFLFVSYQVREDSQTLYGFDTEEERIFFEKLLTVSGIGPKTGISILSEYDIEQLKDIVLRSDANLLSKVSGLGKKGAQKIILELSGKINFDEEIKTNSGIVSDVKSALESLGYSGTSLKEAVEKAKEISKNKDLSLEEVLKLVLKG
jgi:holliday junction DNA helicase RuvA